MKRIAIALVLPLAILLAADAAQAYPSFFNSRCASCHSDDTPTCNGCHEHGPRNLIAAADLPSYAPGASVTVTLSGGQEYGWIRGILYDDNDLVVAMASGPSGRGDDSAGGAVSFPVALQASAPDAVGDYTWQAAWFGGNTDGEGHGEQRVPVNIHVRATPVAESSWSRIKSLY